MKRILCWLGFHKWVEKQLYPFNTMTGSVCERCGWWLMWDGR